jgi:hypothetical protein
LNSECHYPDLSNLFKEVDVTNEIRERYLSVQPKLKEIFTCIRSPQIPDVDIGSYCLEPNECGFKQHCWQQKNIPDMSIFNLPGLRDRKWQLYQAGIITLDNPNLNELNELQERIINSFKNNTRYINKDSIKTALSTWKFPFVFLDFETIGPAIPRYAGCRPFEQLPFQYSVHIWNENDEEIIHKEFLHDTADDPRPTLIPALLEACGEHGSIVAYYSKFEAARIQALAEYSAEHHDALIKLLDRLVDPLDVIRDAVYDNAFSGSFSLKKVAPALLGQAQSYEGMFVANGNDAQRTFEELISTTISPEKKIMLRNAMLEYCEKDTYVMVELVKWLRRVD